jgi:hypothetical protein
VGDVDARPRRASGAAASANAPKAWRFAGELEEIAASFAAHDLPTGSERRGRVYSRMARFKDTDGTTLPEVIEAIKHGGSR